MSSILTRRNFLKTAAAAGAASAAAPALAASSQSTAAPKHWDQTVDVVVLGAGGAGLMAACQVYDKKGKVVVFDKSYSPYHSATRMCGGLFTAYGSAIQKREHAKDSWQEFAHDIMDYGGYMSLKEPVELFAKHSGEAFDWLENHGLAKHHLEKYPGHSNLRAVRQDSYQGKDYIDVLTKQIADRKIKIYEGTPLTKIYFDPKKNEVLGIEATNLDTGKKYNVRALKGVIMATGGITGTPESLDFWVPSVAGKGVSIGCSANDGTAMRIAVRDVGTPISHMQYIASYPCGIVTAGRRGPYCRFWYFTQAGGILINKNGKRFTNELLTRDVVSANELKQPGGIAYLVIDNSIYSKNKMAQNYTAEKLMTKCDTIADVAKLIGVDEKVVQASFDQYHKAFDNKKDDLFGRPEMLIRMDQAPYFVAEVTPGIHHTMGGVKIDPQAEVLTPEKKPIPGLFAAGEVTGGVHGGNRIGGNAVADIITFGRISANSALKYIGK